MDNENKDVKASNKGVWKSVREWVLCIVIALGIALIINKFFIYKVYIPTESMVPTINVDDQLFVTRIYNHDKIERGDVLVFHSDEFDDTYIKRVIGLPGDSIVIDKGKVTVNGEVLEEDYVEFQDKVTSGTYNVPEDKYFFLGDNRALSKDSRKWVNPYIDEEDIQAKAVLKVYPFSDFGLIK